LFRNTAGTLVKLYRHYFFSVAVTLFIAQPLRHTAELPVHVQQEVIELKPGRTAVDFTLPGKLHNTNGHFVLKHGTMRINAATGNAAGELVIDAASGDSSEEDLRAAITGHAVLEVERYPEIIFRPQRIQGIHGVPG
jgi:polyisoprenoid-binding protein YceI